MNSHRRQRFTPRHKLLVTLTAAALLALSGQPAHAADSLFNVPPTLSATASGTSTKPVIKGQVAIDTLDSGKEFFVWLAAINRGQLFLHDLRYGWVAYNPTAKPDPVAVFTSWFSRVYGSLDINILDGQTSVAGLEGTEIYLGVGSNFAEMLAARRYAKVYTLGGAPTRAPDTSPDPIVFATRSGVTAGALVESNTVTITGIDAPTPISATTGVEYRINGGAWTSNPGTVNAGDKLTLRTTAPSYNNYRYTAVVIVGDQRVEFSVSTASLDHAPDLKAPSVTASATGVTIVNNATDADGVGTPTYTLFADAARTQQIASNSSGTFGSLTPATTYWFSIDVPFKNGDYGTWSTRTALGQFTTTAASSGTGTTTAPAIDTTPPTTSAGPSVSSTTDTGTTLAATINEAGTGYYIVQASATAAPSVAQVLAGQDGTGAAAVTSGNAAMTAATSKNFSITGLTASTAYKIYFVAKDSANNAQAAVSSVAVTTAAADVTPPVVPTINSLADGDASNGTGSTGYTNSLAVALNLTDNAPAGDVAGWFVSESSTAPTAGAAGWSATKPTAYTLAAGADGTRSVYVYVKDAAGNVSNGVSANIGLGTVAPSTVAFVSTAPDSKNTSFSNVTLAGDKSFAGATLTVTSRNGGTVSGVAIDGSGQIVIADYTTPGTNPDYLDINGTDKYGNTISIARRVNLPN